MMLSLGFSLPIFRPTEPDRVPARLQVERLLSKPAARVTIADSNRHLVRLAQPKVDVWAPLPRETGAAVHLGHQLAPVRQPDSHGGPDSGPAGVVLDGVSQPGLDGRGLPRLERQ